MFKRKAVNRKNRRINRRRDSSKGRLKIRDTHVNTKFLDAVFSPAIRVKKQYYGVNTALFHSNINTNNYANNSDPKVKIYAVAGDCVSMQALPGRQIYAEFMMFPQAPLNQLGNTSDNTDKLDCLGYDIGKMMDQALQYSNIARMGYYTHSEGDVMPDTNVSVYSSMLANGQYAVIPTYDAENSKFRQTTFFYEGGSHVHEFMNPTNLPIYVELIEYKPRNLMRYSQSAFYSDASDIADINVTRIPGLYESIHLDLCDQKAYEYSAGQSDVKNGSNILSGSATGAADNTQFDKLFNELDDKGFKMSGKMPITNMRWKILNKVVVRIDPGNVYKYTVEHRPFSFTPMELMQYNAHYRLHAQTDATSEQVFTPPTSTAYGFNPLFSRGLAIRAWGSKSFGSNSTLTQRNTFGIDANGGEVVNNVQPNSKNDKTGTTAFPINSVATHSAVITHTCVESHKFRMRARPDNNIKFFTNYMPNASSQNDLTTADTQYQMNPETLNVEALDFENP